MEKTKYKRGLQKEEKKTRNEKRKKKEKKKKAKGVRKRQKIRKMERGLKKGISNSVAYEDEEEGTQKETAQLRRYGIRDSDS